MERIDLSGEWTLRRKSEASVVPMAVPGDIMSALLAAGRIPDPFYDRNELELQWIGREDWEISREIELEPSVLASERVILEFQTLDTIAEIRINGKPLAESSNMFTRFRADAKAMLRPGKNLVSVAIRSPELAAERAAERLAYPIPCSAYPVSSPHRNLLRKVQCMSGWDWGPCLMTGGIYDGASLIALDGPSLEYATTETCRLGDRIGERRWRLEVTAWLDSPEPRELRLEASIARSSSKLGSASRLVSIPAGRSREVLELEVEGVEPWWPVGYGEQPLYRLELRAGDDFIEKRVGFRELQVLSEEDSEGRGMVFRVNGRDIFCKGANWIPADALPSRWTGERLNSLLSSAVEANMNFLRVWGGGRYESDDFYALCDEKGLLVWQDCAFACSLYPSSPDFLASVEAEIRHQVLRLKDHPSLALWCGNNEDIGALAWYPDSKANPMRYVVDYDRLNEGVVGRIVRELDPSRAWWPSSPSGGSADYGDNWHSDGRGDMHFWSVWHEGKSFSEYLAVRPRFCSEFGFQSFPSRRTLLSFAPEGERNITSPSMEHHQRHPRGNSIILETMARYFRMPSGLDATLYLSQVQQAMAIKTAVEYWRSLRPRCMGAIYWQLGDVWPVSSWSSLEYDGGWKLLHYEARRFFEPLHLALIRLGAQIQAVAVNDTAEAWSGRLELRLLRLDGTPVADYSLDARIEGESAAVLRSLDLASLPLAPEEALLEAVLIVSSLSGRTERREELALLTEPKRCALPDPGLEAEAVAGVDGSPGLSLRCAKPALYVACELDSPDLGGRFEDSGFHLLPGRERRLRYLGASRRLDEREMLASLRLMHLKKSYC
jgi:beta-mannosidase